MQVKTGMPLIDPSWFQGFSLLDIKAGGVSFRGVIGGRGPAVLLLHGYPQTHVAWRHVASALAQFFTVIVPDLPGYGESRVLQVSPRWTKRRVGKALVDLMNSLGCARFGVVGHDRGARAGYRLALDHPDRVTAFASLTVIPTLDVFEGVDKAFAMTAWHWFFLAQPSDLPERLLSADPDAFIDAALTKMAGGLDREDATALAAYRHAFQDPSVRHAMCEDYRAAVEEDLEHDTVDRAAGVKLQCPVLVLWPERKSGALRATPVDVWRRWAADVRGRGITGGHLQPEEASEEVLVDLVPFLAETCTS